MCSHDHDYLSSWLHSLDVWRFPDSNQDGSELYSNMKAATNIWYSLRLTPLSPTLNHPVEQRYLVKLYRRHLSCSSSALNRLISDISTLILGFISMSNYSLFRVSRNSLCASGNAPDMTSRTVWSVLHGVVVIWSGWMGDFTLLI